MFYVQYELLARQKPKEVSLLENSVFCMRTTQIRAVQGKTDHLEFLVSTIGSLIYLSSHHVLCVFQTNYYSRNI